MNKEFISCLWKSSKDLRSKYDIRHLDDSVTLEEAFQLAWEAWREAVEQSAQVCMKLSDQFFAEQAIDEGFTSETCAQAIRSKLLDGTD